LACRIDLVGRGTLLKGLLSADLLLLLVLAPFPRSIEAILA
jgi:hypothetical protein